MTINEIIAKETKIAQEFQEVIDTHVTSHNFSLEEMYCDDTEVIEEHLQRCKVLADYHNQIANTIRKYQKIEPKIKVLRHFTEDTPLATQRMIRIVNEISEVLEDGND